MFSAVPTVVQKIWGVYQVLEMVFSYKKRFRFLFSAHNLGGGSPWHSPVLTALLYSSSSRLSAAIEWIGGFGFNSSFFFSFFFFAGLLSTFSFVKLLLPAGRQTIDNFLLMMSPPLAISSRIFKIDMYVCKKGSRLK